MKKKVIGAVASLAVVVAFIVGAPAANRFAEEQSSLERETIVIMSEGSDTSDLAANSGEALATRLATDTLASERPSTDRPTTVFQSSTLAGDRIEEGLF